MNFTIIALIISLVTILVAAFIAATLRRMPAGSARMREIAGYIKTGAMAYLKRQYRMLGVFLAAMALILIGLSVWSDGFGWPMAVSFLLGSFLSLLAGFFGMRAATSANVRTAQAATGGLSPAFRVAFSGGSVMGLLVVGLGALGVCVVTLLFDDVNILTGFSFGASSVALFSRVGGGIYTKAADVGADLVGKVEAGIPEDDPRNPAVIADNVGDNVGDVAGMGADLFESYVGCIVSALLLATALMNARFAEIEKLAVQFPTAIFAAPRHNQLILALVAGGLLAGLIGVLVVRFVPIGAAHIRLRVGTFVSAAGMVGVACWATHMLDGWNAALAVFCGIGAGLLIGQLTEVYTSDRYRTVRMIAKSSETGPATTILSGYAAGMRSTLAPLITLAAAIVLSYMALGFFGVVLAALGMLATVGMIISVDAYGPIADNAGGIAEMAGMDKSVRAVTDHLDSVGNTTAAIGKGFSIGSAALTALALFASYTQAVGIDMVNLVDAWTLAGLLLGGMLAFYFSALAIDAVSKTAGRMIEEVRRQFREKPGIMKGEESPDYTACVDISTRAALRQMILPGIIAIASPVAVGLLMGKAALAGLLAGATVTGVLLAIKMSNAGGAWDNAKKYIEGGELGGKGSEAHKAAVIGDTVGDPLKDTAGPSLNILIKLMSIVAVLFAPLFL